MGLLLDLAPDDGGLDDSGGNDEELEAELLALMGGGGRSGAAGKRPGGKGDDVICRLPAANQTLIIGIFPNLSVSFASCRSGAHGGH